MGWTEVKEYDLLTTELSPAEDRAKIAIDAFLASQGREPSGRELSRVLGCSGTRTHKLLRSLQKKGVLRRAGFGHPARYVSLSPVEDFTRTVRAVLHAAENDGLTGSEIAAQYGLQQSFVTFLLRSYAGQVSPERGR